MKKPRPSTGKFIFGLDSLRCFAIVLVVIYHCFPNFLPGGFIAVEIFFALSGFLIATKLINERTSLNSPKGLKGFLKFTLSRILRFLPGLLACIILTLTLAYFADSDLLTSARENTLYAATFSTNIASILSDSSYESSLIPNLFNHTWFLALELQVCLIAYLVFDFYFGVKKKSESSYEGLSVICLIIGVLSYGLMALLAGRFGLFDRAYFGPDSHIGAFFLGAALSALLMSRPKLSNPAKRRFPLYIIIFILLGGIAVLSPFLSYSSTEPFLYGLPATALASCAVIFLITKLQTDSCPKLLAPFEYLGKISFYIYLFHWPLYILLPDLLNSFVPSDYVPFIAITISILLSILADKFIIPFFSKIRWYKILILALLFVLPVLSLTKAPEVSKIEESITVEIADVPDTSAEESPAIDYSGAGNLSNFLVNDFMAYFDETANFAKVYIAPVRTGAVAHGAYYGSGRAYYNTPDTSSTSLNTLARSRVMVIGDSVTLGAQNNILATVPASFVDALGSRNMFDAINLLAGYRAANGGNLPHVIVIGLVTNYSAFGLDTLQRIVDTAGPGHEFVFMTGNCGAISRDAANNTIRAFANSHGNVHVGDWYSVVINNLAAYTYADNIHLTPAGRQAYADLVNNITSGL